MNKPVRDPTAIVGKTLTDDTAYWRTHPDVERAMCVLEREAKDQSSYELRLILRPAPATPDRPKPPTIYDGAKAPPREPDLSLLVEGDPNYSFMDRLPNLEFLEAFCEPLGDEQFPHGWWWLRLWLADAQ